MCGVGLSGGQKVALGALDKNSIRAGAQFRECVKHLRGGSAGLDRLVPRVSGNPSAGRQVHCGSQAVRPLHSVELIKTDRKNCLRVLYASMTDNRLGHSVTNDKV